jgi:hypothetical protein
MLTRRLLPLQQAVHTAAKPPQQIKMICKGKGKSGRGGSVYESEGRWAVSSSDSSGRQGAPRTHHNGHCNDNDEHAHHNASHCAAVEGGGGIQGAASAVPAAGSVAKAGCDGVARAAAGVQSRHQAGHCSGIQPHRHSDARASGDVRGAAKVLLAPIGAIGPCAGAIAGASTNPGHCAGGAEAAAQPPWQRDGP